MKKQITLQVEMTATFYQTIEVDENDIVELEGKTIINPEILWSGLDETLVNGEPDISYKLRDANYIYVEKDDESIFEGDAYDLTSLYEGIGDFKVIKRDSAIASIIN